jgi:hypothetical protein
MTNSNHIRLDLTRGWPAENRKSTCSRQRLQQDTVVDTSTNSGKLVPPGTLARLRAEHEVNPSPRRVKVDQDASA